MPLRPPGTMSMAPVLLVPLTARHRHITPNSLRTPGTVPRTSPCHTASCRPRPPGLHVQPAVGKAATRIPSDVRDTRLHDAGACGNPTSSTRTSGNISNSPRSAANRSHCGIGALVSNNVPCIHKYVASSPLAQAPHAVGRSSRLPTTCAFSTKTSNSQTSKSVSTSVDFTGLFIQRCGGLYVNIVVLYVT